MNNIKKYLEILAFAGMAIFMCLMFLELNFSDIKSINWKEEPFELTINDEYYGKFEISKKQLPSVKQGDEVILMKKLNKKDYEGKNLVFRTYGSAVEVYVSDKYLYSYGERLYKEGKMLGRGYHIVKINSIEGFNPYLEIKIKPAEKMEYDWIDFLRFSSSDTIWRDLIKDNLFALMLSFFVFFAGIGGYIASIIAYLKHKADSYYQIYAFATAFFLGLWIICTFSFLQFMTNNYESTSVLEYASAYIAVFTYLSTIEIIKKNTKYEQLIRAMRFIYLAYLSGIFVFHITGIIWISQTISFFRVMIVIMMSAIAFIFLADYQKQDKYERILSICNGIAIFLLVIRVILINLDFKDMVTAGKYMQISNMTTMLAVCMVVAAPIFTYIFKALEIEKYEKQIAIFKEIAHKDQLTGLDNRYGGIAYVLQIVKNHIPYSLIMFDLNNLKEVNDTYGHEAGDKLIRRFADFLKQTFAGDEYMNVRHGGDEFVTIARMEDKALLQQKVDELRKLVEQSNLEDKRLWKMGFAYGIASSADAQNEEYEKILAIADEKMYQNKSKAEGR